MATPVTSQQASAPAPASSKLGNLHVDRPVKYGWNALKGAVGGLLDGMAGFGRKGFYIGAGLGLLAGIASGGILVTMAMGAGIGLVAGAGVGSLIGTATGAYKQASLARRRDKYSDEVEERKAARAAREAEEVSAPQPSTVSWRDRVAVSQRVANYNFERAQQQERENDRDYDRYWQDQVSQPHGHSQGKGY